MRRRAMTFSETLIVAMLVGAALLLVALGIATVRTDLRTHQTWELLARLDDALNAYYGSTGSWPVDPRATAERSSASGASESTVIVLAALQRTPKSDQVLERVPEVLRRESYEPDVWIVVDGWGRPLRCMTANSPRTLERQAVAANGGKPIFVSAGGDGRFGLDDVADAADNLLIRPTPLETPEPEAAP